MPIDPEAKSILDKRLASGEIAVAEYNELLGVLQGEDVKQKQHRGHRTAEGLNSIKFHIYQASDTYKKSKHISVFGLPAMRNLLESGEISGDWIARDNEAKEERKVKAWLKQQKLERTEHVRIVPQARDSSEAPRKNKEISHVSRESSLQLKSESSPPKRLKSRTRRLLKLGWNLVLIVFFALGISLIFHIITDPFSDLWKVIPEREKDFPRWIIGKWEEGNDGEIAGWVPRFMIFDSDGTMKSGGGLSSMGLADWEYMVKGGLISITSEVLLPSGNTSQMTLYYIRTNEDTIAPATKSGKIDNEDRYFKK